MADKFTAADELQLLAQPGYWYVKKNESDPWQKFVFQNGATYQINTETASIAFDDVGDVRDEVSDETVTLSLSSGQVLNQDLIELIGGGLFKKTTVAGTPVSGAVQEIDAGWSYDQVIMIENQNGDGTEPTVNTVTQDPGGTPTTLTADTDYFVVKLPEVGWGIMLVDTVDTDPTYGLEIDYDYTPADRVKITRGGVKTIDSIIMAFQTMDGNDEYVTYEFYKVYTDGNLGHGFSPENSAEPITMDLTFTARKDTNRASGDQLYNMDRGATTPLA